MRRAGTENLEVTARGQFVQMVPGDVRVERKMLCDLRGGHTCTGVAHVQVNLPARRVAEGGSHGGDDR
jgi:hypothetical protein